jgi:flagellum-specific peptidoglycan hydrolase FlgJ
MAFAAIFFSCAGTPRVSETAQNPPASEAPSVKSPPPSPLPSSSAPSLKETMPAQETPQAAANTPEGAVLAAIPSAPLPPYFVWRKHLPPAGAPERPQKPDVPELIMGSGVISSEAMSAFLLASNPGAEKEFVEDLVSAYIEESAAEGINHDTAFAQMCLETGYLSFTGLVSPEQNNFCGLGAIGPGQPGERFPDPRTGVRAHIQHLKAYATDVPLKQDLVDPRYYYVRFGSSPEIRGLSGTWAADNLYADKIASILESLYNFAYGP